MSVSANRKRSVSPTWAAKSALMSVAMVLYPLISGSPAFVWYRLRRTSVAATLNGSAVFLRISTRACWFRAGVLKSREAGAGVKKSFARLPMKSANRSAAASAVATKSW